MIYGISYTLLDASNEQLKKHRMFFNSSKLLIDFFSLEIYTWRRKDYENGR